MRFVLLLVWLLCLLPPAQPGIVAFGDSITRGVGATSVEARWIIRLEAALGEPIENLALGGTTALTQTIDQIAPYQGGATVALWMSCTNDLMQDTPAATYETALRQGVAALQARGMAVYLGTCLKPRSGEYRAKNWKVLHPLYMQAIRDVAAETGATLVDVDAVYDPLTMESLIYPFHPDDAGHAAIAQAFLAAMRRRAYVPVVEGAYPAP
jgi:lysophospholipase L1-like esterase